MNNIRESIDQGVLVFGMFRTETVKRAIETKLLKVAREGVFVRGQETKVILSEDVTKPAPAINLISIG